MIQITAKRNQYIDELEVKGHAGSDEYGRDLVCAIVSGIVAGPVSYTHLTLPTTPYV